MAVQARCGNVPGQAAQPLPGPLRARACMRVMAGSLEPTSDGLSVTVTLRVAASGRVGGKSGE